MHHRRKAVENGREEVDETQEAICLLGVREGGDVHGQGVEGNALEGSEDTIVLHMFFLFIFILLFLCCHMFCLFLFFFVIFAIISNIY